MSNYVANYVFCNEELYNDFLNVDFDHKLFQEGMYDPIGCILNQERRLLIFDTRGMEYKHDYIEMIINRYHDVVWNCVEENCVEEGHFYWDGEKVASVVRPLQESSEDCFFTIEYADPDFKMFKTIIGFPNRLVEENFVTNTRREYYLSEFASNHIMNYMDNLRSRIIENTAHGEYPSFTDKTIREEYWFWSKDNYSDCASICKIDADQIDKIDKEELKKGELIIKEVKDYLEEFFKKNRIEFQLSYEDIKEFAVSENDDNKVINNFDRIHDFAVEYRDKYLDPETKECEVEEGFADKCRELGFEMDCGKRFIEAYSEGGFQDYRNLEDIIDEVDDVDLLGSAIFSYWRGVTHWSYTYLLDDDNKKWLITALDRMATLTDPYKDKPFAFDGQLTRILIKSNNICYGPCPDPDEEVMQKLIIINDGRVWVERFVYGEGYPYEVKSRKRCDLSEDSIERIFRAVVDYINGDRPLEYVTDIGFWELYLNDRQGKTFKDSGSMYSDLYSKYGGLSEIIRAELNIPDLFVFDGNNSEKE